MNIWLLLNRVYDGEGEGGPPIEPGEKLLLETGDLLLLETGDGVLLDG